MQKAIFYLPCLIFHKCANTFFVAPVYTVITSQSKPQTRKDGGFYNVELNVILFSRKFCPVSISVLGEKKQVKLSVISKKIISDDTVGKI